MQVRTDKTQTSQAAAYGRKRKEKPERATAVWQPARATAGRWRAHAPGPPINRPDRGSSFQSGYANCSFSRCFTTGGSGKGRPGWRERRSVRLPHAAFPGGCARPSLPPGSSERAREQLRAVWSWRFTFPRLRALPRCSKKERR